MYHNTLKRNEEANERGFERGMNAIVCVACTRVLYLYVKYLFENACILYFVSSLYVSVASTKSFTNLFCVIAIDTERRSYRDIPGYLTKRKSNCPERRAFVDSHRLCSSEIQVDGDAADLTRTTARLYRDYRRPRQMGGRGKCDEVSCQVQSLLESRDYPI